jgi:hypothetical protein
VISLVQRNNLLKYLKGYEYFVKAIEAHTSYETLRLRLQIEYGRLLDWGEAVGISGDGEKFDKKMRMNRPIAMALLAEMWALLQNMSEITQKYDSLVEEWTEEHNDRLRVQPIDTVNLQKYQEIFKSKDIPKDKRRYPKSLNRIIELASGAKEVVKRPKRLQWALADKEKFEVGLSRMRQLTDFLHETLGDHQMKILMDTTRETYLAVLQLSKDLQEIKAVADVAPVPVPTERESGDSESVFSQAETLVDQEDEPATTTSSKTATVFQRLAIFKAENARLYGDRSSTPVSVPKIESDRDLHDRKAVGDSRRETAIYRGQRVWIEFKSYEPEPDITGTTVKYVVPEKAQKDAERLVELLGSNKKPIEFGVPDCVGYFVQPDARCFGFVYNTRNLSVSNADPKSLLQLIQEKKASLKSRVSLAQRLATCLLYLHATNTLHKALRSASILFIDDQKGYELSRPCISSFEYSRSDQNSATSTGAPEKPDWAIYCHPDYLGRPVNFRKSYDIYSLGIILIEIALWDTAGNIFGVHDTGGSLLIPSDPEDKEAAPKLDETRLEELRKIRRIRGWLLGERPEFLERVRTAMGDKYCHAVEACIGGMDHFGLPSEVDQTDPIIATLVQQAYLCLVVDVLHDIVV